VDGVGVGSSKTSASARKSLCLENCERRKGHSTCWWRVVPGWEHRDRRRWRDLQVHRRRGKLEPSNDAEGSNAPNGLAADPADRIDSISRRGRGTKESTGRGWHLLVSRCRKDLDASARSRSPRLRCHHRSARPRILYASGSSPPRGNQTTAVKTDAHTWLYFNGDIA